MDSIKSHLFVNKISLPRRLLVHTTIKNNSMLHMDAIFLSTNSWS